MCAITTYNKFCDFSHFFKYCISENHFFKHRRRRTSSHKSLPQFDLPGIHTICLLLSSFTRNLSLATVYDTRYTNQMCELYDQPLNEEHLNEFHFLFNFVNQRKFTINAQARALFTLE